MKAGVLTHTINADSSRQNENRRLDAHRQPNLPRTIGSAPPTQSSDIEQARPASGRLLHTGWRKRRVVILVSEIDGDLRTRGGCASLARPFWARSHRPPSSDARDEDATCLDAGHARSTFSAQHRLMEMITHARQAYGFTGDLREP